jgi:exoribonuclease-2
VDVAHFVQKGGPVDLEAQRRGSSIYMADQKISMLPTSLAEGLCSLKAGEIRPAISTMIDLTHGLDILRYRLFPSYVQVKEQRTYFDVNLSADQDQKVMQLRSIARKFRESRLAAGAVHISVPEINLWIGDTGEVNLNRVNRESPGRMLVAEIMIMANWLMARFLAEHRMPAVFRSQPEPRERLYRGEDGTLFQHWMQRRLLNRFVLGHAPEKHSGLGLNAYVTATSPIRKYFDLVTQRQVRAVLGLEEPYSTEDIDAIIQALEPPMSRVSVADFIRSSAGYVRANVRNANANGNNSENTAQGGAANASGASRMRSRMKFKSIIVRRGESDGGRQPSKLSKISASDNS